MNFVLLCAGLDLANARAKEAIGYFIAKTLKKSSLCNLRGAKRNRTKSDKITGHSPPARGFKGIVLDY